MSTRPLSRVLSALCSILASAPASASVSVAFKGGNLVISSDAAGDSIAVDGEGAVGAIAVTANAVTTTHHVGVRNIRVSARGGDDTVEFSAIRVGGDVSVRTSGGNDRVDLDDAGSVSLGAFVGGSFEVDTGGQAGDLVTIEVTTNVTDGVLIGGDLRIHGAADILVDADGVSSDVQLDDVNVGGDFVVDRNVGHPVNADGKTIAIDNLNVGGATRVILSGADDSISIKRSCFAAKAIFSLGGGDDILDLDEGPANVVFNAAVKLKGGKGDDLFDTKPTNVFTFAPKTSGFETVQ